MTIKLTEWKWQWIWIWESRMTIKHVHQEWPSNMILFLRTSIDFSQQKSLLHSNLLPGIASSSRAAASWKRTSAYWRTTAAGIDRLNETWGYPIWGWQDDKTGYHGDVWIWNQLFFDVIIHHQHHHFIMGYHDIKKNMEPTSFWYAFWLCLKMGIPPIHDNLWLRNGDQSVPAK